MSCSLPLLPRKRNRSCEPSTSTWRSRIVVSPNELVLARVLVVADADVGGVEQVHDRREHPLAAEVAARHVLVDPLADLRQRRAEGDHPVVLGLVAHRLPSRVVAVLLAAARVAAGGLQVAVRRRADPHVRPRRRDRQRLDLLRPAHAPPARRRRWCTGIPCRAAGARCPAGRRSRSAAPPPEPTTRVRPWQMQPLYSTCQSGTRTVPSSTADRSLQGVMQQRPAQPARDQCVSASCPVTEGVVGEDDRYSVSPGVGFRRGRDSAGRGGWHVRVPRRRGGRGLPLRQRVAAPRHTCEMLTGYSEEPKPLKAYLGLMGVFGALSVGGGGGG